MKYHGIFSKKQSGFIQGDRTINQLISICNLLYKGLDNNDKFIGVFLDLIKAFDKVWLKGLIFKIEKYGINGNLLKSLTSYLTHRKQKVVLNGNSSYTKRFEAGVPQGSVLGPLLFVLYINDFCKNVLSEDFMFADDTSLFKEIRNNMHHAASVVNKDLETMHDWCKLWFVTVNPTKLSICIFPVRSHHHKYLQYIMLISDCNRYLNTSTLASFLHQIYLCQKYICSHC